MTKLCVALADCFETPAGRDPFVGAINLDMQTPLRHRLDPGRQVLRPFAQNFRSFAPEQDHAPFEGLVADDIRSADVLLAARCQRRRPDRCRCRGLHELTATDLFRGFLPRFHLVILCVKWSTPAATTRCVMPQLFNMDSTITSTVANVEC